jgi:hypothetical protein
VCSIKNAKNWRSENRERDNLRVVEWRRKNPVAAAAMLKKFYRVHHERILVQSAASASRRRAREIRATPAWADGEAIIAVYKRAKAIERMTGEKQHVDHIVPLNGKTVCGLHVENNLRVVPALVNLTKANNLDESLLLAA